MNHLGLFSGIGGFEEAFRRAGARLIAMCEIDPQARRVLRRHFPGVGIINDVKEITRETFGGIPIEIITGGFPCQDVSVAGHRKGLAGERSGLWFEFIRIVDLFRPRFVEIENVPGLLSSYSGDDPPSDLQEGEEWEVIEESDFAVIIRGLAELGYCVAWRVLDSQFDGVAQRRDRVFIVASLGTGSCGEVLFERESSAWDSPPSRGAGQGIASTLTQGSGKSCGPKNGNGHPLNLITGPLSARTSAGGGLGTDLECDGGLIPEVANPLVPGSHPNGFNGRDVGNLIAFGGNNQSGPVEVATACRPKNHQDFETETILVSQPITASQFRANGATAGFNGKPVNLQVIAFTERTRAEGRNLETQDELAYALTNPGSGGRTHSRQIAGSFGVRRLTPRECERLQGYPDGWTERGDDGREISDSARYRMLGNAVCLPTVEWIARRVMKEMKS